MSPRFPGALVHGAIALGMGILLRFVLDLHPVWWLLWIAPAPLLVVAFRFPYRRAWWMVAVAALIGAGSNFHYFNLVMPLAATLASIVAQALLWVFLVLSTRRVVVRYRSWWTVLVFPVMGAAADTLMAAMLPDGNWGSLAYSQGDRLVILQVAALFGTAGVLFLPLLVSSALALAVAYGRTLRSAWIAYAGTAVLLGMALVYGAARLRQPVAGTETTFGIVSIDDPIGMRASAAYTAGIVNEYSRHVGELARQGAQIVVLPEKIAVIAPEKVPEWQQHFSEVARENGVWLELGIGIDDGKRPTNWAWLFSPDGALARSYQKHMMAPPERRAHYAVGSGYSLENVGGRNYGLAVCKDMHFAAMGRAYGERHVSLMLVPAWDFDYLDGWLEARTTIVRGVENGYSVVRAAREGLLTASDAYGRVLAETSSSAMPGRSLLVRMMVADPVPTLYTRTGDRFGWICVLAAAVFLVLGRGARPRTTAQPVDTQPAAGQAGQRL